MDIKMKGELPKYSPLRGSPGTASSMGGLTRRRRFVLLVVVCCISLLAFTWYTREDNALPDITLSSLVVADEDDVDLTVRDPVAPEVTPSSLPPITALPVLGDDDLEDLEYADDDEDEAETRSPKGFNEEDLNSAPTPEQKAKPTAPTTLKKDAVAQATSPSGQGVTTPMKNAGLIIDTEGCKIPKLNPWDPTVIGLFEAKQKLECEGPPLFMTPQPNGSIALNATVLNIHYKLKPEDLTCTYKVIQRKHEDPGNVRENAYSVGKSHPLVFGVSLKEDYVGVTCVLGNETTKFEQYFPLVRLRKDLEKERSAIPLPESRLNVILAGVDSVSKLNFLRHFNRTHTFLREKLQPFEMKGYTKVGDNTFPNLVPLLTGHFVEYYWNESVRDEFYFDNIDLIWKEYAKKGYRTFYAEDSPFTGTFNYIKRGFYDPPTDYYFRPLALALEGSDIREHSSSHCYNGQLETDIIYDYLKDFLRTMGDRPYNAFAMVSTMTHDYLNNAGYADDPTVRMLEGLYDSGALNKSMLVIFSDHGLRFGAIRETYIGKFEERMPFMYVHVPQWFLQQHPQIAKNLQDNQERLMTLFDIHATMIHLLDLNRVMSPEEKAKVTQGTSIMGEISTNRTCDEANILPHWCPCQTMEPVPLNSPEAEKCGQAIVDHINGQLSSYDQCSHLEVDKVSDARLGLANDLVMRFVRHDNVVVDRKVVYGDRVRPLEDYMITMTVKPGGAVFEGTVRHDTTQDTYTVLGISRINMYGTTSWCIDSQKMKIYCYCKVQNS